MYKNKNKLALFFLAFLLSTALPLSFTPAIAHAIEVSGQNQQSETMVEPRSPMPYRKTFTTWTTARSATTGGFAYVYIRIDATIDGQNGRVMSIDNAYTYQADSSRYFQRWEQLSLNYSNGGTSIYASASGYAYFSNPNTGFADKYYVAFNNTWYV